MLKQTKEIPPIESFFSSLTNSSISAEDHEFAKIVYETFDCQSLWDYSKVYALSDSFLLYEAVSACRKTFMSKFGLDICYYISLAQYSWDAMLKITGARIELLTDIEQVLFLEQNLRG